MKKSTSFFALIILTLGCGQTESKEYEQMLKSLTNNYTTQQAFDNSFERCWNINEVKFKKDSLDYVETVNQFFLLDEDFLLYMLRFKNDESKYNYWIKTLVPCNSKLSSKDMINNSKGALILIDNLIVNDSSKSIIINDYIDDLMFKHVEKIIRDERTLDAIKPKYIKYIESLK